MKDISIGKKLKELRKEKSLTQKELAQILSVTIPTLSHWECGYQEPSCSDLIHLCQFFNISVDYLLGRTDELGGAIALDRSPTAPVYSNEEAELLAIYRNMTHAQRVRFLAYGEGLMGATAPKFKH